MVLSDAKKFFFYIFNSVASFYIQISMNVYENV